MNVNFNFLGKVTYDAAERLQLEEKERVKSGQSDGTVFFLEHQPAVITLGKNAIASNILIPEKLLKSKGYDVRKVSRGGDVTVHEPGQLVVYFVMPLKSKAVRGFVNNIMNAVCSTLGEFGIKATFDDKKPGLWVEDKKICSIGFDLTGRVSMHGIALNVSNTLEGFAMIVPCGLSGVKMTSLSKELSRNVSVEEVSNILSSKLSF